MLTYEEALRTVGNLLDDSGARCAIMLVSTQEAEVLAGHEPRSRTWTTAALAEEARRQRNHRAERAPSAGPAPRLGRRLRVVGAELDSMGQQRYTVIVSPARVEVQGADGRQRVFEAKRLNRAELLAPHLRGQPDPAQAVRAYGIPADDPTMELFLS